MRQTKYLGNHLERYFSPIEFTADFDSGYTIKYMITFTFHITTNPSFTLAHGWAEYYVGDKLYEREKLAGVAYLHPSHEEELSGYVGMCKSFDHLIRNQIGVEKARRRIRQKAWFYFLNALDALGIKND